MKLKSILQPQVLILAILSSFSTVEGLTTVNNATELNTAIIAANAGSETLIQFGSGFTYSQVFQPLNASNVLNPVNQTFTIDGQGNTLTRTGGTFPGFFARQGTGTITIKDLTIIGGQMQGGNGGDKGAGGGLGAGGGIFLNSGASVILENIGFQNCAATGGNGFATGAFGAGGGGGFGGRGGTTGEGGGGGGASQEEEEQDG